MPVNTIKAVVTYDAICGYCGCKLSDYKDIYVSVIYDGNPQTQRQLNDVARNAGWFYSKEADKNICHHQECVSTWRNEMISKRNNQIE